MNSLKQIEKMTSQSNSEVNIDSPDIVEYPIRRVEDIIQEEESTVVKILLIICFVILLSIEFLLRVSNILMQQKDFQDESSNFAEKYFNETFDHVLV